jgi:outer membrane protein OmpA-like peptidoglycan-associated protein
MSFAKKMLNQKKLSTLLIICLVSIHSFAQQINEQSGTTCNVSRLVSIPFVKDTGSIKRLSNNLISQSVKYSPTDQFSYWYKLRFEDESLINCQISPINKRDQYIVYIYKYKNNDFCERVYNGKTKPVKVENEKNKKSIIEASEANDFSFNAKKGDIFYFCILNVSPENCGHTLRLITGDDTLKINASNICGQPEKPKETIAKVKVLFDSKPNYDTVLIAVQETNKESKKMSATVKITDQNSMKRIKIDSSNTLITKAVIEKGKKYIVDCNVTGYKKFNYTMDIFEYINPTNKTFTIYMKPLKAGDNFIMENIYFHTNTYALKDESQDALNGLLNYLLENPDIKIELQGHTNGNNKAKASKSNKNKGPEWNFSGTAKKLSLLRSEEIKSYLVQKGVNKNNIKTVGFGGDKMIVSNPKSPEALKKNARVEVVIIDDGGL